MADLRRHKALVEYRAVLRDVESAALDASVSLPDLDRAIREEYWERVAEAEARRPPMWSELLVDALGFVVGEVAGVAATGTPIVGGVAGGTAGHVAGDLVDRATRSRWLAVHDRLKRAP